MAKTNNKGFTLIEIVIAVAILSVLLTPIISQFGQTMETSRKAKALQEANETAVYQIEKFQSSSKEELDKLYQDSVTEYKNLPVEIYNTDGSSTGLTLTYSMYVYTLGDADATGKKTIKIGAKSDVYTDTVTLDDLTNQIRAYGGESASEHYKVAYDLTETDLAAFPTSGTDKFELTNEGSIVRYDDTTGAVTAIACETGASYVQNANEVNLGNMQNLDKDTVALILGGTSSYDSDASDALFAKAMEHLRTENPDSWEQALLNVDNESILSTDSLNNSKRLIKIYTDTGNDSSGDYYLVKVDVYYDYNYRLRIDGEDSSKSFHDMVTYTIFSQKFYMDQAPNIYFEYQPYSITESGVTRYQSDDYILFDNNVDETKLYLYKPYKDQLNAYASIDDYYTVDSNGDGINDTKAEEFYTYYTDATKSQKVKIHFASKQKNTPIELDANGNATTTSMDRIYIFTNLDIDGYYNESVDPGTGNTVVTVKTDNVQFVSDGFNGKNDGAADDIFAYVIGKGETKSSATSDLEAAYKKYELGNCYTFTDSSQDPMRILYRLSEDTRESDRAYTITVQLKPDSNILNTVRLCGAKGAN